MKNQLKIYIAMNRAMKAINLKNSKIIKESNLSPAQFSVLEALYHKGVLSVGEVQEKILSTSGTIAVVIRNLEKRKLINRCKCKIDGRKYLLELTQEGKMVIEKVYPIVEKNIINEINILNEEEQKNILSYFKMISKYNCD